VKDTKGEDFYKDLSESYHKAKESEFRQQIETPNYLHLLSRIPDFSNKDAIDLACGTGFYTRILRKMISRDREVWGADISENMIKVAEHVGPPDIKYLVHDCSQPFPLDRKFDLVSATFLLQYSRNYEMLLGFAQNVYNGLNKDGYFIGMNAGVSEGDSIPTFLKFIKKKDLTTECTKNPERNSHEYESVNFTETDEERGINSSIHYNYIKLSSYHRALSEVGFKDIEIYQFKLLDESNEKQAEVYKRCVEAELNMYFF